MKGNHKHGMSRTRLHNRWEAMKGRCYNVNDSRYSTYGARGIKVCEEWLNDFVNFQNWALTNGYTKDLTLERKNVNEGYSPNNCTWIPMIDQALNKSNTLKLEIQGTIFSVNEVSLKYNLKPKTIRSRIKKGYSIEKIIAPIEKQYSYRWPQK